MRILWFTLNPSCFNPNSNNYNGGGWTASLEQIVRKNKNIELGIAFKFPDNVKGNEVTVQLTAYSFRRLNDKK